MHSKPIFIPKDFKKNEIDMILRQVVDLEGKKKIIANWIEELHSGKLHEAAEKQIGMRFIHEIFGLVLGYEYQNPHRWQIGIEPKTDVDATRPDGALGYFEVDKRDIRVVIELKKASTILDKKEYEEIEKNALQGKKHKERRYVHSPIEQAFSYIPKFNSEKCQWAIVSNFREIRLYNQMVGHHKYELFQLETLLLPDNLARFFFLLQEGRLFLEQQESKVDMMLRERNAEELRIENEFYWKYNDFRRLMFFNLWRINSSQNPYHLLSATQKMLDRFVFMCFVRDALPMGNVLGETRKYASLLKFKQENKVWNAIKALFRSYHEGFEVYVPAFNGGLFAPDNLLDEELEVKDSFILDCIDFLLSYDFQSELNVNILGHIFEQSITDLEKLKKEIDTLPTTQLDIEKIQLNLKENGQRKKDGIFYTPNYITQYIVEHSVGEYLNEQKIRLLAQYDGESEGYWKEYENVMRNIKILDPACGSGAFLVATFDFLWNEWRILLEKKAEIEQKKRKGKSKKQEEDYFFGKGDKSSLEEEWKIKKQIVENNIYGVDLNAESIAISRLALWLLQANSFVPLSDLSQNIKQGNALISNSSIDVLAFDWKKEFALVFAHGGFDVIVGNPPYVVKKPEYFSTDFRFVKGNYNTYIAFFEKAFSLCNSVSMIGFIVPTTFFSGDNYSLFRQHLLESYHIVEIVQMPYDVFEAYIDTCIVIVSNQIKEDVTKTYKFATKAPKDAISIKKYEYFPHQKWLAYGKIFLNPAILSIGEKVWFSSKNVKLGHIASINRGCLPPHIEELSAQPNENQNLRWFNGQVIRYKIEQENSKVFVNYSDLRENKTLALYQCPKVLARQLVSRKMRINATYTEDVFAFKKNLYAIYETDKYMDLHYILAILNSKLFSFCQINFNTSLQRDDFPAFSLNDFRNFPIPLISGEEQKIFVEKVTTLLEKNEAIHLQSQRFFKILTANFDLDKLHKNLEKWFLLSNRQLLKELQKQGSKTGMSKQEELLEFFEEQSQKTKAIYDYISQIDKEIDELVYTLYLLNEEEIAIINTFYAQYE